MASALIAKIWTESRCKAAHPNIPDGVTFKTVALTLLIIILSIVIECTVHSEVKLDTTSKRPTSQQPPIESTTVAEPAAPSEAPSEEPRSDEQIITDYNAAKAQSNTHASTWWDPNPSPATRANRLTMATILVVPLCVAFGYRIADTAVPSVISHCAKYFEGRLYPNWWAVSIFNILPFIIGSMAWLRAFVDCLLVRRGQALGYPTETGKPLMGIGWPPCALFMIAGMLIGIPIFAIICLLKWVASLVMGVPVQKIEDIELGGTSEEGMGLVDGVDADDGIGLEGEMSDPPAYDASWRAEELAERSAEQLNESQTKSLA